MTAYDPMLDIDPEVNILDNKKRNKRWFDKLFKNLRFNYVSDFDNVPRIKIPNKENLPSLPLPSEEMIPIQEDTNTLFTLPIDTYEDITLPEAQPNPLLESVNSMDIDVSPSQLDDYIRYVQQRITGIDTTLAGMSNVLNTDSIEDAIRKQQENQTRHKAMISKGDFNLSYNQFANILAAVAGSIKPDNQIAQMLLAHGLEEEQKLSPEYVREQALRERSARMQQIQLLQQEQGLLQREVGQALEAQSATDRLKAQKIANALGTIELKWADHKTQAQVFNLLAQTKYTEALTDEKLRSFMTTVAPLDMKELNDLYRLHKNMEDTALKTLSRDQFTIDALGNVILNTTLSPEQANKVLHSFMDTVKKQNLGATPGTPLAEAQKVLVRNMIESTTTSIFNSKDMQVLDQKSPLYLILLETLKSQAGATTVDPDNTYPKLALIPDKNDSQKLRLIEVGAKDKQVGNINLEIPKALLIQVLTEYTTNPTYTMDAR